MALIERKRQDQGFTLLELTFAVLVVGLIVAGGLPLLKARTEQRMRSEGEAYLVDVKKALLSFVRANKRLPSADINSAPDGNEDVTFDVDGNVTGYSQKGLLPYASLGVKPTDPWGHALTYYISAGLAGTNTPDRICTNTLPSLSGLTSLSTSSFYRPGIKDGAGSDPFNVAVVFASGGPKDAGRDSRKDPFDYEYDPQGGGNNLSGYPYFVNMAPTAWFDDLALYITYAEMYEAVGCGE